MIEYIVAIGMALGFAFLCYLIFTDFEYFYLVLLIILNIEVYEQLLPEWVSYLSFILLGYFIWEIWMEHKD